MKATTMKIFAAILCASLCAETGQAFLFGRVGSITGFTLNSAPDGFKLADLSDGSIYYLNNTNPGLTVVAVSTGRIRRVQMGIDANLNYRTERKAPYTLCGGFSYNACADLKPGASYTITAAPRGGTAKSVKFEIVAGFPPGTPTAPTAPVAPAAPKASVPVAPVVVAPMAPVVVAPAAPKASFPVAPVAPVASTPMAPVAVAPVAPVAPTVPAPIRAPNMTPAASPVVVTPPSCDSSISTYINCITQSGRMLTLSGTTPEDRALQWLVFSDKLLLTPNSEANKARLRQRFALLTWGYQARSDGNLLFNEFKNLNASAHECDWSNQGYGISLEFLCTDGQVTYIAVYFYWLQLEIQGTLPPDLGWLTALQTVFFPSVGIVGTLPPSMGWWTALTAFDISASTITGTIPSSIGAWRGMVDLNVQSIQKLSGTVPSTVAAWTALQTANFFGTNITGIMPTFGVGNFCPKNGIGTTLTANCFNGTGEAKISCICCSLCY
jgi:hypothetical protein